MQTRAPGRGVENRKIPESGQERVQKVFWTKGAKVSQESLGLCATLSYTGATPACTGARGFSLPPSKRLFAPSPNHFQGFSRHGVTNRRSLGEVSVGHSAQQVKHEKAPENFAQFFAQTSARVIRFVATTLFWGMLGVIHCKKNRRSLAIFDRREITHLARRLI